MKKIARQLAHSARAPPTGGPTIVATPVQAVHRPTARPLSAPNVDRSSARLVVVRNAPATPWSTRPAISSSPVGAAPASAEAIAKPTEPAAKTRRWPTRSATPPASR